MKIFALLFGFLYTISISAVAIAGAEEGRFTIIVPVNVSGLPPTVTQGHLACHITTSGNRDIGGRARVNFLLENGEFHGNVRVTIMPRGYPRGVDPIPDGRTAQCKLSFWYLCNKPGRPNAQCKTAWFPPREDDSHRSLFVRKADEPYSINVNMNFNSEDARTLPRRFF